MSIISIKGIFELKKIRYEELKGKILELKN